MKARSKTSMGRMRVEEPGPPPVSTSGVSTVFTLLSVSTIVTSSSGVFSSGRVIDLKICQSLAPSMRAASLKSSGMLLRPASSTISA